MKLLSTVFFALLTGATLANTPTDTLNLKASTVVNRQNNLRPVVNPAGVQTYQCVVRSWEGQVVFHSKNPHDGWSGEGQPDGTYVYYVEASSNGEPVRRQGRIQLVRHEGR